MNIHSSLHSSGPNRSFLPRSGLNTTQLGQCLLGTLRINQQTHFRVALLHLTVVSILIILANSLQLMTYSLLIRWPSCDILHPAKNVRKPCEIHRRTPIPLRSNRIHRHDIRGRELVASQPLALFQAGVHHAQSAVMQPVIPKRLNLLVV